MLAGLNRYVYAPIAALTLWAVVLAVLPVMATAQATHQTQGQQGIDHEDRAAESAVVAPGDSLWSISVGWLDRDTTAQQIAGGVERIYAPNRDQIGADPYLIFAGQRLVLPRAAERGAPESGLGRAARETREAAEPTASPSPPSQVADSGLDRPAEAALAEAHREPQQSADAQPRAALPEPARATPIPGVRTLSPDEPSPSLAQSVASEARSSSSMVAAAAEAFSRGAESWRKLLGSALLAVSSALAIILVRYVAGELWGPELKRWVPGYAQYRARAHQVFGYANANYLSARDLLFRESGQWKRGQSIPLMPLSTYAVPRDELPESPTPVAYSTNGEPFSDAIRKFARSRRHFRTQKLEAKRPLRARAKVAVRGVRLDQVVHSQPISRAKKPRALCRIGGR